MLRERALRQNVTASDIGRCTDERSLSALVLHLCYLEARNKVSKMMLQGGLYF